MKRIALSMTLVALLAGCSGGGGDDSESGSTAAGVSTAGSFSSGSDMRAPRAQHTATLLSDGRVLVVGGTDGVGILADAEVFDPLTGSWELVRNMHANQNAGLMLDATGQFPTARQLHSATRMLDGRVLIAGGVGIERVDFQGQPILETLQSAFIFDPQSNTFERIGDLSAPRAWHEATLLADGRVLLAGGLDAGLRSARTAEIFDPRLGRFVTTTMAGVHGWGNTVRVGNEGLVFGGADVSQAQNGGWAVAGVPAVKAERLAAGTTGFANAGTPTTDRVHAAAASTPSGAFFAGGQVVSGGMLTATNTTERYNAQTQSFEAGPTLATARFGARAVSSGNAVFVIGGLSATGTQLATVEIYDNGSNTMIGTAQMLMARSDFQATRLLDGRILITGGMDAQNAATTRTELYR